MRIAVLTGSGISADSGVDTFRDAGGVWAQYDYREVATPEGFSVNPALVHEFYNARRRALRDVAPNAAHRALARLQDALEAKGGSLTLITQNVDDLHERAGSRGALHVHGELRRAECAHCGAVWACEGDLSTKTECAVCACAGGARPHVVWFGEIPRHLDEAEAAVARADRFVSIGTSGSVYPAAGLVHVAKAHGVPATELNLEPSENAAVFDEARYGRASEIVPLWADEMLAAAR